MDKWQGKTAVVTGAGKGNGARITHDLALNGMNVIALDCTDESIAAIDLYSKSATLEGKGKITSRKCDLQIKEDLIAAFDYIEENFGGVDVLINHAATAYEGLLCDLETDIINDTVDTNLTGIIHCTRLAVESMKRRKSLSHIIMVNSISGHYIPHCKKPVLNMYAVSKHALKTFVDSLVQEFKDLNLNIKVTNLPTGLLDTLLLEEHTKDLSVFFSEKPLLKVEDVSEIILMILRSPPHVQMH